MASGLYIFNALLARQHCLRALVCKFHKTALMMNSQFPVNISPLFRTISYLHADIAIF